ncbi:MAG: 4-hydroxy-tetrahydrodipicolinate reductase [Pirellula sp.]|jgi:4-hydroxy-tetrahydrodipicolinate reductase
MSNKIDLVIHGASGRNGKRLIALGSIDPQVQLVGALVRSGSSACGHDAGSYSGTNPIGLSIGDRWPDKFDCVIDFSSPDGCLNALEHCVKKGSSIVIATTGLEATHLDAIERASRTIPVCLAPNTSVAVNIGMKLVEQAAKAFRDVPGGADVEIIERHHRYKEDSPSGTAVKLGQIIAQQMGIDRHVHGRQGMIGKRPHNEIGYHAVRVGDDVGQHTVVFGMMGELVEIRVAASNRDSYASGAISAAKYLNGKPAKLYSMADVLGL